MKTKFRTAGVLLAVMASAPAFAGADEDAVKAADARLNALILQRDTEGARAMYADDFVLTTSSGKVKHKTDMVNEVAAPDVRMSVNQTSNIEVRVHGDTAVLTADLAQKGEYQGKSFDVVLDVTDTWIRVDGKWLLLAGHASKRPQ
ncbi:nuclear transport factor 2 family protein [Tahibacter amnicola]|uniref:Nuclear transport factor 2 family protein n=1 Tax=Tahibacter amnicola TaxID=2976241 RepID=A0ABY6BK48_9GAMM|nr:nuclear transport factor 2 family protein [Tahibacter amnicola]UXI70386.1 nuclear transport factor 2 family protein [Tahibacter amnicola]